MTFPSVFCAVPVHNRLETTTQFVEQMQRQDWPALRLVIVDDGSTDGTGEYLASLASHSVIVLRGDGSLWWGGAMRMAMTAIDTMAAAGDYLLMLNDDVQIASDYVSRMVADSDEGRSVVASLQLDEEDGRILSAGCRLDWEQFGFQNIQHLPAGEGPDAVSGRGMLVPIAAMREVGPIRTALFHHYLADYDYSYRLHCAGYPIRISAGAPVRTASRSSDAKVMQKGFFAKYFSGRSKHNILLRAAFFLVNGQGRGRIGLIVRMLRVFGWGWMRIVR